ncbi:MAG TPA: SMI1/KNR4 family protein [Pseudonocardiaceae bacterium]|nr:SMI1/KNR4 family protein [Pseudonocardiaceae bacterium]
MLELSQLLATGRPSHGAVKGLTESELSDLENGLGVPRLPGAYREFMRLMGRGAGRLLAGTDAFYPEIVEYQEEARDLLNESPINDSLVKDALIFAIHQGYQVYWMSDVSSDDPPVLMYQENQDNVSFEWDSFTDFVNDQYGEIAGR